MAHATDRIDSWFRIAPEIRQELDPILSDYELALSHGLAPAHEPFLGRCTTARGEVLASELAWYDRYYQESRQRPEPPSRPPSPDLSRVPETIGNYQLIRHIGGGSFSNVFLAFDREQNRRVALKITGIDEVNPEGRICFEREVEALKQIDHPRIVRFLDSFQHGRLYVCVTDWIDGVTLKDALADGPMPLRETVNWLVECAEGLHYVHQKGLLHRDIKPQNIMIDRKAHVRIVDFGLARIRYRKLPDGADSLRVGQLKGSISYMSPEQAQGEVDLLDARSDVFSLGVVMYEALTGQRAFDTRPEMALAQIVSHNPPGIRAINPELPEELERICSKAMAKQPADRYPTAQQMQYDLVAFQLASQPVSSRTRGAATRGAATRGALRPRQAWKIALPLLVAAVLATAYLVWPRSGGGRADNPSDDALAGQVTGHSAAARLGPATAPAVLVDVLLKTVPEPSTVYLVPLDHAGQPLLDQVIDAGSSPVRRKVPAGDYLVTAIAPDGEFHEVLRRVPLPNEMPHIHKSFSWWRAEGYVELPEIRIVTPVKTGMADCGDVMIDRLATASSNFPYIIRSFISAPVPREGLTLGEAAQFLEESGKRLPFLWELEMAVKNGQITDSDQKPEWTATVHSLRHVLVSGPEDHFIRAAKFRTFGGGDPSPPQSEGSLCVFRGVRSKQPLVLRSSGTRGAGQSGIHQHQGLEDLD